MNPIKRNDIWGPWATVGWGLFVFIVWILSQAVPVLAVFVSRLHQNGGKEASKLIGSLVENGYVLGLSTSLGGMVAIGVLWLIIVSRKGAKFPEYLGLQPLKLKTVLYVLGLAVAFCLVIDLLTYSLGKDIIARFMVNCYTTGGNLVLFILGINLLGPLFEEIYFRGFLFEGFRNSKLGNVGTVLLTTVAWASLHLQYDLYQIGTIFVSGLLLGCLRLKTGSLWSCILFHIMMNFWATIETILYFHGFTFLYLSKS